MKRMQPGDFPYWEERIGDFSVSAQGRYDPSLSVDDARYPYRPPRKRDSVWGISLWGADGLIGGDITYKVAKERAIRLMKLKRKGLTEKVKKL